MRHAPKMQQQNKVAGIVAGAGGASKAASGNVASNANANNSGNGNNWPKVAVAVVPTASAQQLGQEWKQEDSDGQATMMDGVGAKGEFRAEMPGRCMLAKYLSLPKELELISPLSLTKHTDGAPPSSRQKIPRKGGVAGPGDRPTEADIKDRERARELDREAERERERQREKEIRAFRDFSTKLPLKKDKETASRRVRGASFAAEQEELMRMQPQHGVGVGGGSVYGQLGPLYPIGSTVARGGPLDMSGMATGVVAGYAQMMSGSGVGQVAVGGANWGGAGGQGGGGVANGAGRKVQPKVLPRSLAVPPLDAQSQAGGVGRYRGGRLQVQGPVGGGVPVPLGAGSAGLNGIAFSSNATPPSNNLYSQQSDYGEAFLGGGGEQGDLRPSPRAAMLADGGGSGRAAGGGMAAVGVQGGLQQVGRGNGGRGGLQQQRHALGQDHGSGGVLPQLRSYEQGFGGLGSDHGLGHGMSGGGMQSQPRAGQGGGGNFAGSQGAGGMGGGVGANAIGGRHQKLHVAPLNRAHR